MIHGDADVGEPKVASAAAFVEELNPDVGVEPHDVRVGPENVADLVADYDFVVDGSDNFRTRYLVNDACTLAGIPFSHGAVYRFEGQVTTFTEGSPCYRCLFAEAPPAGTVPDCATTGVLGVLPGVIGAIQATEAVKHLVGVGESLDGRLLHYDALGMTFEELPNPAEPRLSNLRRGRYRVGRRRRVRRVVCGRGVIVMVRFGPPGTGGRHLPAGCRTAPDERVPRDVRVTRRVAARAGS